MFNTSKNAPSSTHEKALRFSSKFVLGTRRGIDSVTISVHGHDDLGMAVANFMSAIEGGARQVSVLDCTIPSVF